MQPLAIFRPLKDSKNLFYKTVVYFIYLYFFFFILIYYVDFFLLFPGTLDFQSWWLWFFSLLCYIVYQIIYYTYNI